MPVVNQFREFGDGSGLTYYGWKFNETSFAFATTESPGTITLKVKKMNT